MNLLRDENLNWRHKFYELCTDYDLLNESHKEYILVSVDFAHFHVLHRRQ